LFRSCKTHEVSRICAQGTQHAGNSCPSPVARRGRFGTCLGGAESVGFDPRWGRTCTTARIFGARSEEHTSELQSRFDLVCRLLLEKKKKTINKNEIHITYKKCENKLINDKQKKE